MEPLTEQVATLSAQVEAACQKIGLDRLSAHAAEADKQAADPELWQDQTRAQKVVREQASLKSQIEPWQELRIGLSEAHELLELRDETLSSEIESQVKSLQDALTVSKKTSSLVGRTTLMQPSSACMLGQGVPTHRIGQACYCVCMCAGRSKTTVA